MYLAQGHNTAEIGIKPPTSPSGVGDSTTRPPPSPLLVLQHGKTYKFKIFSKLNGHLSRIMRKSAFCIYEKQRQRSAAL